MSETKNTPTHKVFQIRDRGENQKSAWTDIGVGFTNRDGSINVLLNSLPLDGKVQVRVYEPRKAE